MREVFDEDELERRTLDVFAARGERPNELLTSRVRPRNGRFWLAFDSDDNCFALAVVAQDLEIAFLAWMISADRTGRGNARYLLSAELFQELARDGVRYVITDSPLFCHPGVRHFSQLLGFRPRNLVLRSLR